MAQQQQSQSSQRRTIPHVECPRCHTSMRLALIEPAGATESGRDTLVYECICGFAFKQPVTES
jgi:hypothetical protein